MSLVDHEDVLALIDLALQEDIGSGDVTTRVIFTVAKTARAHIKTRTTTVACGLEVATAVFHSVDAALDVVPHAHEGDDLRPEAVLLEVQGDVRSILTAERCALNFLMRLCGIAHGARTAARQIPHDCAARVYDTRKTTPGWRRLEKHAVATGGAQNHRMGLYDAMLIKDNHIAAAGSITEAVAKARAHAQRLSIEVEIDRLDQLDEAIASGADIVLLDNFSDADMRAAVVHARGRVELEASGGVTLARLAAIARTGVQRISMGALTHSVTPADLTLEFLDALPLAPPGGERVGGSGGGERDRIGRAGI